ncbi:hypothetical protein JNUCC64_32275 [Streptomyces sp. JNUCC 64]
MALPQGLGGEVLLEQGQCEAQEAAIVDDEAGLLQLPDQMLRGKRTGMYGTVLVQDECGETGQGLPYLWQGLRALALEDASGELREQLPGGDLRVAAGTQTAGQGVNLQRTGQQLPRLMPVRDPDMVLAQHSAQQLQTPPRGPGRHGQTLVVLHTSRARPGGRQHTDARPDEN